MSKEAFSTFDLSAITEFTPQIARVTGMDWFSTEIAYYKKNGATTPVVVDYINDQCHVDVKSIFPSAPPDQVVKHIAETMVEAAYQHRNGIAYRQKSDLWLHGNA